MKHMIKRAMAVLLVVCMMAAMFAVPAAAESSLDDNLKLHYNFDSVDQFTPIVGTKSGYTHTIDNPKATFTVGNGAVKNTDPMVGLKVPDDDAAKFYLTQSSGTYYLKFKVESWSSSTTATLFDMRSRANRSLAIGIEEGKLKVWSASNNDQGNVIVVEGAEPTNEFVEIAVSFNKDDGTNSIVRVFYKKASDSTWTSTSKVNLNMEAKAGSHPRLFSNCFDNQIGINVKAEIDALCVYTTAATDATNIGTVLAGDKSVDYDFESADSLNNFTAITRQNGTYSLMTGSTPSDNGLYSAKDGVVTNHNAYVGLEVPSTDATKFDVNQTQGTYYLKFKVEDWSDSTIATLFDMRSSSSRALAIGIQDGILKVWADSTTTTKAAHTVTGAEATNGFVEIAVSFDKGTTDSTVSIFYKAANATEWTATTPITFEGGAMTRGITPRFYSSCFGDGQGISETVAMDDFRVYDKALTESELCKVSYEVTPANYAPAMKEGAAVRMVTDSQGIRFTSAISEDTLAFIDSIKDTGSTVTLGTVIAPLDYVNKASEFTMAAMDAAADLESVETKYVNISATDAGKEVKDGVVTFNAALVNLKGYNHTRTFAARAYVQFTMNGEIVILYSAYTENDNARSMSAIAQAALNDVVDSRDEDNGYIFQLTAGDNREKWSCYNDVERTALNGYLTDKES